MVFFQRVTLILARTEAGVNKTLSGTMSVNVGTAMKGGIAQTVRKDFIKVHYIAIIMYT